MPRFGFQIPPEGCLPQDIATAARAAEKAGFGWVSVSDHMVATRGKGGLRRGVGSLDAYVAISAAVQATSSITCGVLVSNPILRHPVFLAKVAASLDRLSGGRFEQGLGTGWLELEHRMYGFPFPTPSERLQMFEESAEVMALLWQSEQPVNYGGRWVQLEDAECLPGPQRRFIPLWAGGIGGPKFFGVVARWFSGWNAVTPSVDRFRTGRLRLEAACESQDRDPAGVRTSVGVFVSGPDEQRAAIERSYAQARGLSDEEVRSQVLGGSTAEIVDRLGAFIDAGANDILIVAYPPLRSEMISWLAEEVLSAFGGATADRAS